MVEKYIIETDQNKLLDNPGGNLKALNGLILGFGYSNQGSNELWSKLIQMLELETAKKKYKYDLGMIIHAIQILSHKKIENTFIWTSYIIDLEKHIEDKTLDINQVFTVMRSLYAVNMLDDNLATELVKYLIKKGYSATDLIRMNAYEK